MLNSNVKQQINNARDILVGKIPDPKGQIDQITNALIYKFMDDQDRLSLTLPGGKENFFVDELKPYAWHKLFDTKLSNQDKANLYVEGVAKLSVSKHLPDLFQDIFKDAFLPFRAPDTIAMFLNEINKFDYKHSEDLGNAFEYLLSFLSVQGDLGSFRTPRNIIEFIVDAVDPSKDDSILDPACGTAGFLIEAYKHITKDKKLAPNEIQELAKHIQGVDIDPGMAKIARVNLYLHGFKTPIITEDDTLSDVKLWGKKYNVILANPPFMTPKGGIVPHDKFSLKSNRAEVLFTDYIAEHLLLGGRAGVVVPEGIIFQSGDAYKKLRKMLVDDHYLWAVISLPAGVFNPYSGVKTSILLLDRERATKNTEILFFKINNDGFDLGAQRRENSKNDLPEALGILKKWKNGEKVDNSKALYVEKEKIAESGDYNLSIDRYGTPIDYSNAKWPMITLGEICELSRGVVYSKSDEVSIDGYKILRANNITLDDSLLLDDIKLISKDLNLKDSQKLKAGDIFICLASGSNSHIGKVAYISQDTDYYFGGFMGAVRIKSEIISPLYLFYLLKDQKFNDFLNQEISGANINNLNFGILSRYKIPLPPIEIQKEIVEQIEGKQKAIEGAKQVIENLERERECFGQIITKLSNVAWVNFDEVVRTVTPPNKIQKTCFKDDGKYPIIDQSKDEIAGWTNDESSVIFINKPVVIFGDHTCAIKYSDIPFAQGADGIKILETKELIMPKFLYFYLKSGVVKTDGYKRHFSILKEIKLPIIDTDTQENLIKKAEYLEDVIKYNKTFINVMTQKINEVLKNL